MALGRPRGAAVSEFGVLMRTQREIAGLTQQHIANRLGCSVPYVSDLERGRRDPSSDEDVATIAQMVGVSVGRMRAAALRSRPVLRIDTGSLTDTQRSALYALLLSWQR